MNIMVTGSGTNIGNKIAKILLKNNYNVICAYNKNYPKNLKKYKKSNIVKINLNNKINKFFKVNVLIHCASATPEKYKGKFFEKINVRGFENLLKKTNNKKLKKIILISSISIYEKNKEKIINENILPKFQSKYASSKMKQEIVLKKFKKKGVNKIILRLPSILSKNCKVNFYCNAISKIKKGQKIRLIGIRKKINSIFYIDDLLKIMLKFVKENQKHNIVTYNLASRKPMKMLDLISLMFKKLKKPKKIDLVDKNVKNYIVSIKKLAKINFKIPTTYETLNKFLSVV